METRAPIPEIVNSFVGRVVIPLARALVGAGICALLAGLVSWGFFGSSHWLLWGAVVGALGFAAGWYLAIDGEETHQVTRTIAPEPVVEREPIVFTSHLDKATRPQTNRRKWQFLEACRKLAAKGESTRLRSFEPQFGKDEALRLRDELIAEGYLSIDNPKRNTFVVSSSCLSGGGAKETRASG